MNLWTFKRYVSPSGSNPVEDWYQGELSPKGQARVDTILEHFSSQPHHNWPQGQFKPLTGHDGIFEIRFTINNVLWRPLGYFGPNKQEFTILVPAREQGDKFIPKNAPALAEARIKEIAKGEATTDEFPL